MKKGRELSSLQQYYVVLSNEKNSNVINETLEYFVRQSIWYKRFYLLLSILAMMLNSCIPLINQINFQKSKLVVTIISSIGVIVTSLLSLLTVKESWNRYRDCAERLKMECNKFNGRVMPYQSSSVRKNEQCLIQAYHEICLSERRMWKQQDNGKQDEESSDEKDNTRYYSMSCDADTENKTEKIEE